MLARKISILIVFSSFLLFLVSAQVNAQVFELGTIEVYGSYFEDEPSSCSVIFPDQYKGEFKDLGDLLSNIPGVRVTRLGGRGAYTVISIRGSTAGQVAVYLNGVLMNMGGEYAVDLSTIPLNAVEKIEVYRGSVPARFGIAGIGGVINIITKKNAKFDTTGFTVGSFRTYRFEVLKKLRKGLLSLNLESSKGDYPYHNDNGTPYTPDDDYDPRRKNNAYRISDIRISKDVNGTKLFFAYFTKHRELPNPAPGDDREDCVSHSNLSLSRFIGEVSGDFSFSEETVGEASLYFLLSQKEFWNPRGDLGWPDQRHNWYNSGKIGLSFSLNRILGENSMLEFHFETFLEELRPGGDIISSTWSPLEKIHSYYRRASILSLEYTLSSGNLLLIPWVRWLSSSENGGKLSSSSDHLGYGMRLKYSLSDRWSLKSTWGKYVRVPDFYEKFGDGAFILPNPSLKSERGENFDFGVEYRTSLFSGYLTYFRSDVDDLIELVMANPRYAYYKNIGRAKIEGIELSLSKAFKNGWMFSLSYTYMNAVNKSSGYRKDKPLPNRPEHSLSARLTRVSGRWSTFVEGRYVGENYFDTGGLVKFSDWWSLDLGFSYFISKGERISLVVKNITDNQDLKVMPASSFGPERMADYPPVGRSFYLSYIKNF